MKCIDCRKLKPNRYAKRCVDCWKKYNIGDNHPNWKGDTVGYTKMHEWIENNWKKPRLCENCHKEKKLDWANLSGEYRRSDRTDWKALCRKCHAKYDWKPERNIQMSKQIVEWRKTVAGKEHAERLRLLSIGRNKRPNYVKGTFNHSEESKRKMSEASKGRKFSKEHIKHLSESHKGLKYSNRNSPKLSIKL